MPSHALRSAAIALLDVRPASMQLEVRAQGLSLLGRLRPIDPGLLWTASLMPRALPIFYSDLRQCPLSRRY
jgi:hypothetical protein